MVGMFDKAKAKLSARGKTVWGRVTGPTTALVATLRRLNWTWIDAHTVKDGIGNILVFGLDAPKTFASATQASVRRWRIARIGKMFPQLIPKFADTHVSSSTPTMVIDLFGAVSPLVKGKAAPNKITAAWSNSWAPELASTMNGGQWPQVRKAGVQKWNITDSRCQLCLAEQGTLPHRFLCSKTAAERCQKLPPKEAATAQLRLSEERLHLLRHRAIGVVKVLAPRVRTSGTFKWLRDPFDARCQHDLATATWYTDGSMLLGRWAPLRCTGFGVVVVAL